MLAPEVVGEIGQGGGTVPVPTLAKMLAADELIKAGLSQDAAFTAAERVLAAVAPVILSAYRKALLADAFPDEDSDYHYGCERLLDLVRDGIPPTTS